jgi:predicted outer membrane repeat protein
MFFLRVKKLKRSKKNNRSRTYILTECFQRRTGHIRCFSLLICLFSITSLVPIKSDSLSSVPVSSTHIDAHSSLSRKINKIVYVKKDAAGNNTGETWEDAFNSLQAGLDAAIAGDEIRVAQGVYTPTQQTVIDDPRSVTFSLKQGVKLYGGFLGGEISVSERDWRLNQTILSGDLLGDDVGLTENKDENAYHVVTAWNVDQSIRLDGFIIRGGYADTSCYSCRSSGSRPRLDLDIPLQESNVISGNQVDTCDPNTSFESGGGLYACTASPVLANLVFTGNYANQGGGLYAKESSMLMVECAWIGNRAEFGGGIMNSYSSPTIVNAIFDGNSAGTLAGGLYNLLWSEPLIVNTTFVNNYDTYGAKTILNTHHSQLEVWNSIIWAASGDHFKNEEESTTTLSYSILRGGCSGYVGLTCYETLDEDPLFWDEDGEDNVTGTLDDDLRLNSASCAIDYGDNSAVPADTLDLDDDGDILEPLPIDWSDGPRFMDTMMEDKGSGMPPLVDMGAFETYNQVFLPVVRKAGSF